MKSIFDEFYIDMKRMFIEMQVEIREIRDTRKVFNRDKRSLVDTSLESPKPDLSYEKQYVMTDFFY